MTVGSKVKQTLASLRGAESILRVYENQSQHPEAKEAFQRAVEGVEDVIYNLEERMKKLEFEEPQYKGF